MEHELEGINVAVTGATGFVGGHLTRRLLTLGARTSAVGRQLHRAQDLLDAGATPVSFDLRNPETFAAAVEGQQIVFHVAAWLGRGDPSLAHDINVEATEALVAAAVAAGVERFVLVSTVAAYGAPHTDTVVESHPLDVDQSDRYGRTKAQGEIAAHRARTGDLELVVVRPAMVFGPGSTGWTKGMLGLVKSGTPGSVRPGPGSRLSDLHRQPDRRPRAVGDRTRSRG